MPILNLILSDEEKYSDDKHNIKKIFLYAESVGLSETFDKKEEFEKLYKHAYGILDIDDYINPKQMAEMKKELNCDPVEVIDLKSYPIVPSIVQGILGDFDKKYIEYNAYDILPESKNEIITQMSETLRQNLIQAIENKFMLENQDLEESEFTQKYELLKKSEDYLKFMKTEYKSVLEQWANNTINIEDAKFSMKNLSRKLLEQITVTNRPYCHVNYTNGDYYPEVIPEENVFYLKSPESECVSEGMMVGFFQYENIATVLNKYGSVLKEDDFIKLQNWVQKYFNSSFVLNDFNRDGNYNRADESIQNFIAFDRLKAEPELKNPNTLMRRTTIYNFIPRKKYKLTFKQGETVFSDIVSEEFKVTYKPIYKKGQPKTADNLIEGEHIEAFWDNELYRCVKLDVNRLSTMVLNTENRDLSSIWIECEKMPIQFSGKDGRYSKIIPVFGGPPLRGDVLHNSIVKTVAPHAVMFNWVWNRSKQLMKNEVGKFMMFNELVIPKRTIDGSWDNDNSLGTFMQVAKDMSLAPINTSVTNTGEPINPVTGGVGQVIDLTKQAEILEKIQLADAIKAECFRSVGLQPDYIYGNVQGEQSARTVAMGQQRSSTQIQHLYTRLNSIMERIRTCMLECAQVIAVQNPTIEMTYNMSAESKQIFRMETDRLPLSKFGVYIKSNLEDQSVMEEIRRYVATTNTLGADTIEMATLFSFKSLPELFNKLKVIKENRKQEALEQQEREAQMQQQQLEGQQQMQRELLMAQKEEKQLDREKDILVAQLRALGGAEDPAQMIADQAVRLQELDLKRADLFDRIDARNISNNLQYTKTNNERDKSEQDRFLQEKIKMKELELREKDIEARNKRTKAID